MWITIRRSRESAIYSKIVILGYAFKLQEISPILLKNSFEIQRTIKILKHPFQGEPSKLERNFSKGTTVWRSREPAKCLKIFLREMPPSWGEICQNRPRAPVWRSGKQAKFSKIYPREFPPSWREISPKLLQKNHSLEILKTSYIIKNCVPSWCLQDRENLQNCSKRTTIRRSSEPGI